MDSKTANTGHPVHELIRKRWSPRSISSKPVERKKLLSLLEAARWAPSSFNEQSWRYIVATKENPSALEAAQSVLNENNSWAKAAPVLICSVGKKAFTRNDKLNFHWMHDVGAATENMLLEAFNQGLVMHEMAGFSHEKAVEVFRIPEGFEPVAMIAVGYQDIPEKLKENEKWHASEIAERKRKPLNEIAFENE